MKQHSIDYQQPINQMDYEQSTNHQRGTQTANEQSTNHQRGKQQMMTSEQVTLYRLIDHLSDHTADYDGISHDLKEVMALEALLIRNRSTLELSKLLNISNPAKLIFNLRDKGLIICVTNKDEHGFVKYFIPAMERTATREFINSITAGEIA